MEPYIYAVISDKRSIPFNSSGTGTISTVGQKIIGVGTSFSTELQAGSYLVDLTNWEFRKVYSRDSDTVAWLEIPFTSDISAGTTPEIIAKTQVGVKEISISTAGAALLNNVAFTGELTLSKTGDDRSARRDLIAPIIVDATGITMKVSIIY